MLKPPSTAASATEEELLKAELSTMPPPPSTVGRPQARQAFTKPAFTAASPANTRVGPVRREPGQPGATLRTAPAASARPMPGMWQGPSEVQERHRKRITEAREDIRVLLAAVGHGTARVLALVAALRGADGGKAEAEREGFGLEQAEAFANDLNAVLDKYAPPAPVPTVEPETPAV